MRPKSRANRVAFRRAVWASVALHVVAASALIVFVRTGESLPAAPGIDTRASEPQVRMSLPEVALDVAPPQPEPPSKPQPAEPLRPPPTEPMPPQTTAVVKPQEVEPLSPLAASRPAPQMLPSTMLALIRKPVAQSTETPNPPSSPSSPVVDPNVQPAGATSGASENAAPAIHGALNPNQVVVYVLDCSGSMGASGKLDAARAALVSTLKQQPTSVRFQVIVYAGSAMALLAGNGNALPATEANVRAATDTLAKLEARGKSNHLEAVRAAVAFRPDVILLLTDADDLNTKALKAVVASGPKVVSVCVGQVTTAGVQRPRELK